MKPIPPEDDLWWLFHESGAELGERAASLEPVLGARFEQDQLIAALCPGHVSPPVPHAGRVAAVARWRRVAGLLAELPIVHRATIRFAYEPRNWPAVAGGAQLQTSFGIAAAVVLRERRVSAAAVKFWQETVKALKEAKMETRNAKAELTSARLRQASADGRATRMVLDAHRAWREQKSEADAEAKAARQEARAVERERDDEQAKLVAEVRRTARRERNPLLSMLSGILRRGGYGARRVGG